MRRILALAAGLLIALILAQLVLPGIAAQRLRDQLGRHGRVLAVRVSAFPAIELLWHRADRVVIRIARYTASASSLAASIGQVADTGSLEVSAAVVHAGLLTLRDATLRKRGAELSGRATVSEADLRAALPILDTLTPVGSGGGGGGALTLRGTGTLLGVSATVEATVRPAAGALVISPNIPFGSLATVTLFSSPRVEVQSIAATPSPGGFTATVRARLR